MKTLFQFEKELSENELFENFSQEFLTEKTLSLMTIINTFLSVSNQKIDKNTYKKILNHLDTKYKNRTDMSEETVYSVMKYIQSLM